MPVMAGAASLLVNPDFDLDLSGWTTTGDAQHSTDFAVLTDAASSSTIHQSSTDGPGQFSLAIDFAGALSSEGALLDTAFFSVYLGDNPFVSPTSPGSFDEAITLFDLDANGINNLDPAVSIFPHPSRPGWSRASIEFVSASSNITPYVQLLDQNAIQGNSSVGLDRFELAFVVPEPTVGLLLLAAGGLCLTRRRKF